jgi:hypothetical protein
MWKVWLHHSAEILATDGGVVGYCDVPAPLLARPTGAWAASSHALAREPIALLFLPRVTLHFSDTVAGFSMATT